MKAKEFDRRFDAGEEVHSELDLAKAHRPRRSQKRVNVDFPEWMLQELDTEAARLGVTRQSIIKIWLSERLEQTATNRRDRITP